MTGSIQIKNGKYYAVINTTDINGKRKQKWIATGLEVKGNKKKAEQFLRDKLTDLEENSSGKSSDILFCDYIEHWLDIVKIKIDKNTYQSYNVIANAHILPYFKQHQISLKNVTRTDIQNYVNTKFERGRIDGKCGLSAKTVKSHLVIIKQALKEACKNELIPFNPSDNIVIPKVHRYEANFYTSSQLNDLFEAIKNEELYYLVYFTAVFGLRRSEVLGLKWDSISADYSMLTIKHTVVKFSEIIEKDRTKNNSSYRSFPLSAEVKKILVELKNKEQANRELFGNEYIENDYIFKWDNGKPYTPDYISKKFNTLLKKYNLPIIRFHDLRHSCASLLIANGFTLKDIQEWLGHSDIQTTANIYSHLDIERKTSIANSMISSIKI